MLARSYASDVGSERFDSRIDLSCRSAAEKITQADFRNLSLVQLSELFSVYPDIYARLREEGIDGRR